MIIEQGVMIIEGAQQKMEVDINMKEASIQKYKESDDNVIEVKVGKWGTEDQKKQVPVTIKLLSQTDLNQL